MFTVNIYKLNYYIIFIERYKYLDTNVVVTLLMCYKITYLYGTE